MKTKSLLKNWTLREEPLTTTAEMATLVLNRTEGWMQVESLPCDVHMALEAAGRIEEPLTAGNSFDCEWVEKRSWWFRKSFTLTEEELSPFGVELFIEMLDVHADIYLNGAHIAHHPSAMYAFRKNVRPWLRGGENELLIRLSTGLEYVTDEQIAPVREFVACEFRSRRKGRGEERRVMLRKPQYVFGWDQSPRLGTCAIAGDVRLEILDGVAVRDIRFETKRITDAGAELLIEAEIESLGRLFAKECIAKMVIEKDGKTVYETKREFLSQPGVNYCDFSFTMENPALWWPNGYGAQPLYTVRVEAEDAKGAKDTREILTGIRTVSLDMTDLGNNERKYAFRVNGKLIYCKGMDYIHVDCLYARATAAQHEKLLTAARDANFNMVRFWDGNLYQSDFVHQLCDRFGILVLENFCFACGAYPDHLEEFRREAEAEAIYQMRRLRSHPCVALWYGNGECHGLLGDYLKRHYFEEMDPAIYTGGTYLYNELLPRLHRGLIATVGYQVCTPFGGFEDQQCAERGDMHYYPFLNLAPSNQQYRISTDSFDDLACKFITESGVMGPPSAEALARYCGGVENTDFESPIFEHHRNTFERWAVRDAIYRHYTGERKLSLDEYCLYGGLFQGMLLSYAADKIRLARECGGSVLWCFTDGFGEVGFSLMDHDGNPKPAYHFLRRAYAPSRMILNRVGDRAELSCANDTDRARTLHLTVGYVSFDGTYGPSERYTVELPAYTKLQAVTALSLNGVELQNGTVYARADEADVLPVILRGGDFRTLNTPKSPKLTVSDVEKTEGAMIFTVSSDVFAHAVHFNLGASVKLSDEYFDLLPGEERRVTVFANEISAEELRPTCVTL